MLAFPHPRVLSPFVCMYLAADNIGFSHMSLDEPDEAEEYLRRAIAVAPDSRLVSGSGDDRVDITARYNLGTLLVNRILQPPATVEPERRLASAREASELFCEVLLRHGGTERTECERIGTLPCADLQQLLDKLRAQHAADAALQGSNVDGGGAVKSRALAHGSSKRLYQIAFVTATNVAACR
jgi:hypothetical protein